MSSPETDNHLMPIDMAVAIALGILALVALGWVLFGG